MALTDKLSAIGDAIRAGTGKNGLLTLDEMPGEIAGLGSGTASAPPKEVNFYDYDGTILYSYTTDEMMTLTALPPLPSHSGLICQGWNWTLEGLQGAGRSMNVGAMYITDDGKTRLHITIVDAGGTTANLRIMQSVANGVVIDWGDGSETQTGDDTGALSFSHAYQSVGDYVISLDPVDGCELGLGADASAYCVLGPTANNATSQRNMLQKVEVGRNVSAIQSYAFRNCYGLKTITLPVGVTSIGNDAFRWCAALTASILPVGLTAIDTFGFIYCVSMTVSILPDGLSTYGSYAYSNDYSLAVHYVPGSVTSIEANAFVNCYGMEAYDFTRHTSVPTLAATSAFTGITPGCVMRVPAALEAEWKAATNWATYANYIVGV